MNIITIIGRLTKQPEKSVLNTGMAVANFSVAVKNRKGEATFFNCKAFGKTADLVEKYCGKGSQVGITGSMQSRKWTKDGITRETWELVVDGVTLLGGNNATTVDGDNSAPTASMDKLKPADGDEDMPF